MTDNSHDKFTHFEIFFFQQLNWVKISHLNPGTIRHSSANLQDLIYWAKENLQFPTDPDDFFI